jgi:hypothetical protein
VLHHQINSVFAFKKPLKTAYVFVIALGHDFYLAAQSSLTKGGKYLAESIILLEIERLHEGFHAAAFLSALKQTLIKEDAAYSRLPQFADRRILLHNVELCQ